jgi:hypothetical protein
MAETMIAFDVQVIDGEILPVPGVDVGARFSYPAASSTWSNAVTDAEGYAHFDDLHPESPHSVCLYVADDDCGTFSVADGCEIVVEM